MHNRGKGKVVVWVRQVVEGDQGQEIGRRMVDGASRGARTGIGAKSSLPQLGSAVSSRYPIHMPNHLNLIAVADHPTIAIEKADCANNT